MQIMNGDHIEQTRKGLESAIRAAKLALFVINKQGVMPNDSWKSGFDADLKTAEAALAALPSSSYKPEIEWGPVYGSPPSIEAMKQIIAANARRYAEMYQPHSDGRNTFVIFAEWVEQQGKQT